MSAIETDYLVVGSGAAGMAFVDALIADADVDVVMVDRRDRPGGHWNDAYPFVRLHQPSSYYGVNSRVLGHDTIDTAGPNAGLYERATAAEILDYFGRVLDEQFLPSGQVQAFGLSEYQGEDGAGEHRFVSRLTGEATTVGVRAKLVDATYLETQIPATHTPSFTVDADARLIPVNGLVDVADAPSGYTIIGAGKTAMDACVWLLDNGVDPGEIRWIRAREAWLLDRAYQQPRDLVGSLIEGVSLGLEAAAQATDRADLFSRLEECGQLIRMDPDVEPTMYRCATVSWGELEDLRSIEHVVRAGHVLRVGASELVLASGSVPTGPQHVYVDCSATGLRPSTPRPVFEPGRITMQPVRTCQPTFNAALLGYLEASRIDDAEKNRLSPPNPYPSAALDWIAATRISERTQAAWSAEPDVNEWMRNSRLDAASALRDHMDEPEVRASVTRYLTNVRPAIDNLGTLLAQPSS